MSDTTPHISAAQRRKQHGEMLKQLQASPESFRQSLIIDADAGPVRLGEVLDQWQQTDFRSLDPAWHYVAHRGDKRPHFRRAWLERPRGHSKTADLAAMVTWVLFASPRRLAGLAAAADREQAKLLRDAIAKLVATNPWLSSYLEVQAFRVVNLHTESTLEIISSDAPSSYGVMPDCVICDEITHWTRRDLFDSLISSAAKRSHCLFLVICNAGFQESWQWELRERIRQDPAWFFHSLAGPQASWISQEQLAEQKRLLPRIAYERLWLNLWGSGSGDAIEPDDLQYAIHTTPTVTHPAAGWAYVAGIDLGLKRDASAVVVLGRHVGHCETIHKSKPLPAGPLGVMIDLGLIETDGNYGDDETEYRYTDPTGRLAVATVDLWKPQPGERVSLTEIENTLRRLDEMFRFVAVGADPWQAAMLIERLQVAGMPIESCDFTGPHMKLMASCMLEAFRERNIELPDHSPLISDLRKLRVTERSYGIRLESPRDGTGHGDSATALAISLLVASRHTSGPPARVNGPLVCWP